MLVIGKVTALASKPAMIAAGLGKMPFGQFSGIILALNLVLYLIYMSFGYFFDRWVLKLLLVR